MNYLALLLLVILLFLLALPFYYPLHFERLKSHPNPVKDYASVAKRLPALSTIEEGAVDSVGETTLLDHGQQVEWAIALIHGYTNCPEQFRLLGEQFFNRGCNVLIPRQPHHGLIDRLNTAHGDLPAEELVLFTDNVVDILHGLGRHTILCGLSGGGVMTAWAATFRSDLDIAMPIAPILGPHVTPTWLHRAVASLLVVLPNQFSWWDKDRKMGGGPKYAYPRYASRTIGEYMRLGELVLNQAHKKPPAAQLVILVTNECDHAVDNVLVNQLAELWRKRDASGLRTYTFPLSLNVGHDLIDPHQPDQRVDVVYPRLIEEIEAAKRFSS